jgi:hypothetical protein
MELDRLVDAANSCLHLRLLLHSGQGVRNCWRWPRRSLPSAGLRARAHLRLWTHKHISTRFASHLPAQDTTSLSHSINEGTRPPQGTMQDCKTKDTQNIYKIHTSKNKQIHNPYNPSTNCSTDSAVRTWIVLIVRLFRSSVLLQLACILYVFCIPLALQSWSPLWDRHINIHSRSQDKSAATKSQSEP